MNARRMIQDEDATAPQLAKENSTAESKPDAKDLPCEITTLDVDFLCWLDELL